MSWKRWIHEVRYTVRLTSPLHIGAGEDELLVNERGHAVIPGSSLAGAWRAYAEQHDPVVAVRLFGRRKEEGSGISDLHVHDLVSERVAAFEERPAVRIDGAFGSVDGRGKFDRYYVAANEMFKGTLVWTANEEEKDDYLNLMKQVFAALHQGMIRLGKYKSTGAGSMKIETIRHRAYDCWNPQEYFNFLYDHTEDPERSEVWGEDASEWLGQKDSHSFCQFRLTADLVSPLLIRGSRVTLENEPDAISIQNFDGEYIIPGSSWKGALRTQVEQIARFYGVSELVEEIFGRSPKAGLEGKSGAVIFSDALIENHRESDYTGIRIDRLTGTVMSRMLKQERTVRGSVELRLDLQPNRWRQDADTLSSIKGLLLLAFRDLAEQGLTLGGGYAVGRGRLQGKRLFVQEGADRIAIDFEKEETESLEIVNAWISALAGRRTG